MSKATYDAESLSLIRQDLEQSAGKIRILVESMQKAEIESAVANYVAEMERGLKGIGDFVMSAERNIRHAVIASVSSRGAETAKKTATAASGRPRKRA